MQSGFRSFCLLDRVILSIYTEPKNLECAIITTGRVKSTWWKKVYFEEGKKLNFLEEGNTVMIIFLLLIGINIFLINLIPYFILIKNLHILLIVFMICHNNFVD
jgi:hypothetical protein